MVATVSEAEVFASAGFTDLFIAYRVLVEVDSGHRRTGVAPDEVAALADVTRHAGLTVSGVFTFPGHSYSPGVRAAVAAQEAAALAVAAGALRSLGIEAPTVSGGATPTVGAVAAGSMTELRPGVYLRVVPNHVCSAVNLADVLSGVHRGRVVDTWPVAARGANT